MAKKSEKAMTQDFLNEAKVGDNMVVGVTLDAVDQQPVILHCVEDLGGETKSFDVLSRGVVIGSVDAVKENGKWSQV